eukprot:m.648829 g.648829  ORF g.648829 m.648829 type:complete len:73 (-) comp22663_c0_seq13:1476-1694(-)
MSMCARVSRQVEGVYGSRMTGGGFGGCTVTLAHKKCQEQLLKTVTEGSPHATCFFTGPGNGARVVALPKSSI